MQNAKCKISEALLFLGIILCALLCLFKSSYANPSERLNIDAEAEYKFSNFERDPAPELTPLGSNLSQDYRLYLDGGFFKDGFFDELLGVSFNDKYRPDDVDLENNLRFDYGRWLEVSVLNKHETDEEIFFSGSSEPQSPIHTLTKKYNTKAAINSVSSIEYIAEGIKRKDLLLGTVTAEENKSQALRFTADSSPLDIRSEYRQNNFDDFLGTRSDIESNDLSLDLSYRPVDYFGLAAFLEDGKDKDISNGTELKVLDRRIEFSLMPLKELKIRNRLGLREDNDTKTDEDISKLSEEVILNFGLTRQIDLEFAYKKEEEDKKMASSDIDSSLNEEKFRARFMPYRQVNIQAGYEVSDKESTSSSENIKNTKMYSGFSFQPLEPLRLSLNLSGIEQKNTFTSAVESDTKSLSANMQYRPKQAIALFMQFDTNKTDNPSTSAFTKTDTLSSSLSIDPFSFLGASLRMSEQKTDGSSISALSERLLKALEFNFKPFDSLRLSTEYELIDSSGSAASNEDLFDIAAFYNIGKLDFSLRYQDRSVSGDTLTDKTTVLSNVKYRFSTNAVLAFRFSLIDYTDRNILANSYDSTTAETSLSMRF